MTTKHTLPPKYTDYIIAAVAALLAFFIYLQTLAPTVLPGDSGEFQFAAPRLGIAHPTGYPLYLLLGKLFTLLPLGDIAYRVSLMSAFFAALTVGMLYLLLMQCTCLNVVEPRYLLRAIGALTALLFAFSATFWRHAVIAEVYTLNAFFVALLLYLLLLLHQTPRRAQRLLIIISFIYGLSLTHHRTMLLLAPAFALYIWLTAPALLRRPRLLLACLISIVAPLALYLYIPLRAAQTPWLHLRLNESQELLLYENSWRGFWDFVLGRTFGGLLGYRSETITRLRQTIPLLLTQFNILGVFLGGWGLSVLSITRRWRLVMLTTLIYLITVGFCAVYFIDDIAAYYIPSYMIFAIWIGGAANLRVRAPRHQRIITYLLIGLLAGSVTRQLNINYRRVDQSHNFAAQEQWHKILAAAPQHAILLTNDRDEMVPLFYYQYVENRRRDLTGLFPQIVPAAAYADVVSLTDTARGAGRPICFIKPMEGLDIKYRLARRDVLTCVEEAGAAEPPQYTLTANFANTLQLVGADVTFSSQDTTITLRWQVLAQPPQDYATFVHLLDRADEKFAQSDHRPGGVYYPPSAWQAGDILLDTHVITTVQPASRLIIGVYEPYTQQRLPIVDNQNATSPDYAVVELVDQ